MKNRKFKPSDFKRDLEKARYELLCEAYFMRKDGLDYINSPRFGAYFCENCRNNLPRDILAYPEQEKQKFWAILEKFEEWTKGTAQKEFAKLPLDDFDKFENIVSKRYKCGLSWIK